MTLKAGLVDSVELLIAEIATRCHQCTAACLGTIRRKLNILKKKLRKWNTGCIHGFIMPSSMTSSRFTSTLGHNKVLSLKKLKSREKKL